MHPRASYGFDGISSWLLKLIKPVLTKYLTLITNQILTTGIFPDKLKTAKVIPIYKKGDETLSCNYRPISILPALSKVIETIIYDSFLYKDTHLCTIVSMDLERNILRNLSFLN